MPDCHKHQSVLINRTYRVSTRTVSGKHIARRVSARLARSQGPAGEERRCGCFPSFHGMVHPVNLHSCPPSIPRQGSLLPTLGLLINPMESLIGEPRTKMFLGPSSPPCLAAISSSTSNPFGYALPVSFTGHPTNLRRQAFFPLSFLTRTLSLREVKKSCPKSQSS